jgi:rhodanese-related sulfurtransferase
MNEIKILLVCFLGLFMSSCQNASNKQESQNTRSSASELEQVSAKEVAIRNISMLHLKNRLDYIDTEFEVMDVRTAEEFEAGAIPKAVNLDVLQEDKFRSEVEKLDKSKTYFVYCRSGQRSQTAFGIMNEMGFDQVYNVTGGYLKWEELQAEEE